MLQLPKSSIFYAWISDAGSEVTDLKDFISKVRILWNRIKSKQWQKQTTGFNLQKHWKLLAVDEFRNKCSWNKAEQWQKFWKIKLQEPD